jgi:hypothetical protein
VLEISFIEDEGYSRPIGNIDGWIHEASDAMDGFVCQLVAVEEEPEHGKLTL